MVNNSVWPMDMTLTTITTRGQSGTESNSNEGVLHILQTPRHGPHHQIQFNVILKILNEIKYCHLILLFQSHINYLFAHSDLKYNNGLNNSIWPIDRNQQVLPFRLRVDLRVIVMNRYSKFLPSDAGHDNFLVNPETAFDIIWRHLEIRIFDFKRARSFRHFMVSSWRNDGVCVGGGNVSWGKSPCRKRRLVSNYAVVFRPGWVYSLCHRRSRRWQLFLRGTFYFFSLSARSRFLWFYQSMF